MHYLFILLGFLSLVSFSVVLTPILFKKLRRFVFLKVLVMISLCDTLTAISYLLNLFRPVQVSELHSNNLCKIQGVIYSFSINASISWTIALSIQLYTITKNLKPYFNSEIKMHFLFWSIPVINELIPLLSESNYGMDDTYPEAAVNSCYIRTGALTSASEATYFITNATYKIIGIVVLVVLYYKTKKMINSKSNSQAFNEATKIMILYPLAMIFLWLPNVLYSFVMYVFALENDDAMYVFGFISSLYGIVVTGIYFYGSKQARHNWYTLLTEFSTDNRLLT